MVVNFNAGSWGRAVLRPSRCAGPERAAAAPLWKAGWTEPAWKGIENPRKSGSYGKGLKEPTEEEEPTRASSETQSIKPSRIT